MRCGYKPRDGITKGQFFIDDIFGWGSALVDAYLLESKEAIYPRVIIDEKTKIMGKLIWLKTFEERNKQFWEDFKK